MTAFPKQPRPKKERKPMARIGPVGRRRLAANKARKPLAEREGYYNICELRPVLSMLGITHTRCEGDIEWCHASKKRCKDAEPGTPEHEDTCCRGCQRHHYFFTDILPPAKTQEVVMMAIRFRGLSE